MTNVLQTGPLSEYDSAYVEALIGVKTPQIETALLVTALQELQRNRVAGGLILDEITDLLSYFASTTDHPEQQEHVHITNPYNLMSVSRICFDLMVAKYPNLTGEEVAQAMISRLQSTLGLTRSQKEIR